MNSLYRFLLPLLMAISCLAAPANAAGVVSAADPRAAAAGQKMLRAGGSATDAAMAMMLALTVVEPQSSGIGGGGFLIRHDGTTGQAETLDGRETAPASARPDMFLGADGRPMGYMQAVPGGLSVGVPGNIALMAEAHQRWGKLPWAKLFEPAIEMAEKGYEVAPVLETRLAAVETLWADFPDARAIYWQDGRPKRAGERVVNKPLAATLRRIARAGPQEFYTGETARQIVKAVTSAPRNPTPMTLADLKAYAVKDRPPVCAPYRQWRICGMGPPSSGATTVIGILKLLERFDMAALGSGNAVSWHLLGEAMRLAYADRDRYMGDADFVDVPWQGMIDPAYLAQRSKLISEKKTLGRYLPGVPPGAPAAADVPPAREAGTTHFVATDSDGNVVSMTSTVEGPFGSQLIAGGMFLNNELTDFSFLPERDGVAAANRVEPGKRPLSSMSPTIVYDDQGRVVLALGSAGGRRIIMHVAKTLVGVLDWQLSLADAMALPNIFFSSEGLLVEKGTKLEALVPELGRLGQTVVPATLPSKLNGAERVGGGWTGAADPRGTGEALTE